MTDTPERQRAHPPETTEGWYALHQILAWDRPALRAISAERLPSLRQEAARVLDKMAPDDAADLLGELEQERRLPVLNLMSPGQQHKLRKLMQYHPTTAGGLMSPDYVSVVRGTTAAEAIEAVEIDDKAPHQLLNTVFIIEPEGKFLGSVSLADLVRADAERKVEDMDLTNCSIGASADFADVTLMMADYNLTALAVIDRAGNMIGAISVDDLLEALVPEGWRNRVEASTGV